MGKFNVSQGKENALLNKMNELNIFEKENQNKYKNRYKQSEHFIVLPLKAEIVDI